MHLNLRRCHFSKRYNAQIFTWRFSRSQMCLGNRPDIWQGAYELPGRSFNEVKNILASRRHCGLFSPATTDAVSLDPNGNSSSAVRMDTSRIAGCTVIDLFLLNHKNNTAAPALSIRCGGHPRQPPDLTRLGPRQADIVDGIWLGTAC